MDNIHGSGPIRPNIPNDETTSASKASKQNEAVLERAPSSLRAFTKQLGEALHPLQDEKQGLKSTLSAGRALDGAVTSLKNGDVSGGLSAIKEAQSLPGLPSELQGILSKSESLLSKEGSPEEQLSGLQNLNDAYMHTASMQAMDFSHKIIKSGESLGRMTMDLKGLLENVKLSI